MKQDATLWRPGTCNCEFYIRLDAQGNVVFLDADDVRREHQARVDAGDPTASKIVTGVCPSCGAEYPEFFPFDTPVPIKIVKCLACEIKLNRKVRINEHKQKLCSAHAAKGHRLQDIVPVVQEEQSRRTSVLAIIKDINGDIHPEDSFDDDRILRLAVPAEFSNDEMQQVQLACDIAHGQGKVKVKKG